MEIKKLLIAIPMLLALTACSCGNKISKDHGADLGDSMSSVATDAVESIEGSNFFKGKVADRVFFATNKSTLNHESKETLKQQAEMLKGSPNVNVVVEGHCDERGTREYNLALGERRADAAKKGLCHNMNNCDKVSTVSYGKERPEMQGNNAESWAQNRRAVTTVSE
jgi:peptidoglycan-associated lipoprotein